MSQYQQRAADQIRRKEYPSGRKNTLFTLSDLSGKIFEKIIMKECVKIVESFIKAELPYGS